ncbi:MAG: hypothetical protein ACRDCE_01520 [Cetobacterium sp.]|uniref:hypothetical protein n=1 Tax=Cetobacterium sp. TaxID=2071632 RepID=UPI003EE4CFCE
MRTRKSHQMEVGNTVTTASGKTITITGRDYADKASGDLFTIIMDGKEKVVTYMSLYSLLFNPRKSPKYSLTKPYGETIPVKSKKEAVNIISSDLGVNEYRASKILKENTTYIFEEK